MDIDMEQGLEKVIPDTPSNVTPVHLRDWQIFADHRPVLRRGERDVGIPKDAPVNSGSKAPS